MQAFTIRDNKAETYGVPFFQPNLVVAMRSVGDAMADGRNTMWTSHPADFALYHVGEFDDTEGALEGSPRTFICNLNELEGASQAVEEGFNADNVTGIGSN